MNLDEETFLTAYLDDELPSELRRGVESALASDPGLAERLRDLASVRDLVAGLAHPASSLDLSGPIVATLRRRQLQRQGHDVGPAAWSARVVALISAAAALVACASIGLIRNPPPETRPLAVLPAPPVVSPEIAGPGPILAEPVVDPGRLALTRDDHRQEQEAREVRALLESPRLRKILLVTDVVGGDADHRVEDLLETTPRRSATYGRLTISQGIVIDPAHPGAATVFAVVMDDLELRQFRARLNESFPESVSETDAEPEVVTQLAEIGQIAVLPGTTVASVFVPEGPGPGSALKAAPTPRGAGGSVTLVPEHPGVDPLDVPIPTENENALARSVAAPRPRPTPPSPPPLRPASAESSSSVVLVWVSTPRREDAGRLR